MIYFIITSVIVAAISSIATAYFVSSEKRKIAERYTNQTTISIARHLAYRGVLITPRQMDAVSNAIASGTNFRLGYVYTHCNQSECYQKYGVNSPKVISN